MFLQPLVENAIRHGIGALGAAGSLRIEAGQRGPAVEVRVIDDGPGLTGGLPSPGGPGTGLATIGARLRSHFGDAARVALHPVVPRGVVPSYRSRSPTRTEHGH